MTYDIRLSIPEDSTGGQLITTLTTERQITPSQAVEGIINEAAQREVGPSLVPNGPETPTQFVERLRARKEARGAATQRPPMSHINPEAFFGMLAGDREFSRAMDEIIAGRVKRYGFDE